MGKRGVFFLILFLVLVSFVSAEIAFYVPEDTDYCIKFSCENGGATCSSSAICNISINYPNSTAVVGTNLTSNLENGYFQFCLNKNQTNIKGEYFTRVECSDGGLNDTSTFIYEVNPTGIRPSDQKTNTILVSVGVLFLLGTLLFIAFLFSNQNPSVRLSFLVFSVILFLITINLSFVNIQDAVVNTRIEGFFDGFTSISWIIYWFLGAFLIIMWIFTFINTWLFKKNQQNISKFGEQAW